MSDRDGSVIERLWIWMTWFSIDLSWFRNSLINFRVLVCRIRLYPTLISKIKWLEKQTTLIFSQKRKNMTQLLNINSRTNLKRSTCSFLLVPLLSPRQKLTGLFKQLNSFDFWKLDKIVLRLADWLANQNQAFPCLAQSE